MESPVRPVSETLYVDISLPAGGRFDIPPLATERALYAVAGAYRLGGTRMEPYAMAVLPAGDTVRVEAETPARITDAASEWSAHQTPRIEGEKDWVPLPKSLPP
jgi:redox-sensitive bicupin YhaK (pirin superfamily)